MELILQEKKNDTMSIKKVCYKLYQNSTLKCPNCNAILSVFSFPDVFGDDTGYYCEKCNFTGYYGGTRCEGQSLWQIISEDTKIE